ncbi:MAG: HU family DNA-binding protein [Deltaproteobacteria bacterium]|nr:HU family DNA-binding protein [Deltaproteobacteria bacterium]
MTKAQLVENIAAQTKLSKADSQRALEAFLDTAVKTLKSSGKLTLTGFGTFSVSNRKARTGRNPRTGQPIQIKAGKRVGFKAGKALKSAL